MALKTAPSLTSSVLFICAIVIPWVPGAPVCQFVFAYLMSSIKIGDEVVELYYWSKIGAKSSGPSNLRRSP